MKYKDGEPCGHPGCCNHITHPCEGCGRIGCSQSLTTEWRLDQVLGQLSFASQQNKGEFSWTDPDGAYWDNPVSYLQGYVLGMCCCGDPVGNLKYIADRLELIKVHNRIDIDFEARCKEKKRLEKVLFNDEVSRDFFYYWADSVDLSEHGSVIPGWLTEKGQALLSDIRLLEMSGYFDYWEEEEEEV